jgi:hypothetical protein
LRGWPEASFASQGIAKFSIVAAFFQASSPRSPSIVGGFSVNRHSTAAGGGTAAEAFAAGAAGRLPEQPGSTATRAKIATTARSSRENAGMFRLFS